MTRFAAATLPEFFEARAALRDDFLDTHLVSYENLHLIGEDWGTRRYYRLNAPVRTYILMEAVPACFPFATLGHRLDDFIKIATALTQAGLHAPAIIAADIDEGYVLIEDMGDTRLWDAIGHGTDERIIYECAADVLHKFQDSFADNNILVLPRYQDSYIHTARRRIIDWYMPVQRGQKNPDGVVEAYLSAWDEIEKNLPPAPMGFVHGDFHLQNLMWLPTADGVRRCGILDFQDAMWGPLPYDIANLCDDVRRDVPADLRLSLIKRRMAGMDAHQRETFMAWYNVLAAQFHCRIIGQVIRLALVQGKTSHLNNLARVQAHLSRELSMPLLAPVKQCLDSYGLRFDQKLEIDVEKWRGLIRLDAF